MNIFKNKFSIKTSVTLSLVLSMAFPSFAEEAKVDNEDNSNLTQEQKDQINFVSKYEVDLNNVDKKYVFDFANASIKFTVKNGNKYFISVNGEKLDDKFLGKTQINNKTGETSYTFYAVDIKHGKNIIKATELSESGDIIKELTKDVYVKSKPAKITIEPVNIPADGTSVGKVVFLVEDEFGNPVPNDYPMTIRLQSGTIKSKDEDSTAYGHQVKLVEGRAEIYVQAPNQVGIAKIDVDSGDIRAFSQIEYKTPYKEPMFLGTANLQPHYNFLENSSIIARDHSVAEKDLGKIRGLGLNFGGNFFGQGTIFNDFLLTFAYSGSGWLYQENILNDPNLGFKESNIKEKKLGFKDTSRKLNGLEDDQNILQRDRAEDKMYPIYGDSSQIYQIAVANSPVFFKLEKDLSHLMWGDFSTASKDNNFTNSTLSNYNRTMTGGKLTLNLPNITNLDLFVAATNQAYSRDEIGGDIDPNGIFKDEFGIDKESVKDVRYKEIKFQGLGVSGPYKLRNYPIVSGSERISIETRAKSNYSLTKQPIKTPRTMNRLSDYNIDYSTGTIIFSQPVPINDNGDDKTYNVIVVTYDYYPKDISSGAVFGGKINQPIAFGASVGGSFVKELSNKEPYQLWGLNISEKLGDNFDLIGEYANSVSDISLPDGKKQKDIQGQSFRVAFSSKPIDGLSLQGEYQNANKDFVNRTGASFTPGGERYTGRGNYKFATGTDLSLDFNRSKIFDAVDKNQIGNTLQTLTSKVAQDFWGNNISLGYENRLFPKPTNAKETALGQLAIIGYKSPNFFNFSFNAGREQNFGEIDSSKPTTSYVGLDYNLGSNMKIYTKGNMYDALIPAKDGTSKQTTSPAFSATIGIDGGFNINESDYFNSVNVGGKFKTDRLQNERDGQNTFGTNAKIGILPGLSIGGNWDYVFGKAPTGYGDNYNAYSFNFDYAPNYALIRASGKYDIRVGNMPSQLYSLNLGGGITDDIGLIGKFNHSISSDSERKLTTEGIFGLAYRPLNFDWINGLARYQIKRDYLGAGILSNTLRHVPSLEIVLEPMRNLEFFLKGAVRIGEENTVIEKKEFISNSNILLGVLRGRYKFAYNYDFIAEYRNKYDFNPAGYIDPNTNEYKDLKETIHTINLEFGYSPIKNLRLAIGYNYLMSDTSSDSFTGKNKILTDDIKYIYSTNYITSGPYMNMSMDFDGVTSLWKNLGIFTKKDLLEEQNKLASSGIINSAKSGDVK
ncbi:MAG: hypothetical protein U0457_20305 [Candidatus Sericytochromatia bacterium]